MGDNSKPAVDLRADGEHIQFNDARERTGGLRSEGVVTLAPGGPGPGTHIHTRQNEGFEVVSGTMLVTLHGEEATLEPGDSVVVQAGEVHTFRNGSDTSELVVRFWYEPALRLEWMLQTMGEMAMERGGAWKNVPLLEGGHILFAMRSEYRFAGWPFWLQDVVFGLLAGLAVLTGRARRADGRGPQFDAGEAAPD